MNPLFNPIEIVWEYIKSQIRSRLFVDLKFLKNKVAIVVNSRSEEIICSLRKYQYIALPPEVLIAEI